MFQIFENTFIISKRVSKSTINLAYCVFLLVIVEFYVD